MEEFRSSEVLDREIYADAQRKAERIRAQATQSAQALLQGVPDRLEQSQKQALAQAQSQAAQHEKNVTASIPLEKQRYAVSYVSQAVIAAMNGYFDALGQQKRLSVVESLVQRSVPVLGGRTVSAQVTGFGTKEAAAMLKKHLGQSLGTVTQGDDRLLADEAVGGFAFREGIVLKADDGTITCRLSLDQKVREVLDSHREELCAALFGGRIPE